MKPVIKPFVKPFIQLAPMEGVLDWTLRELLSDVGGIDRMVTEFVRVTDRLLPDHVFLKYCPELEQGGRTRSGTPVFIQLLGGDPDSLAANAERAAALGAPGIDLNFGCPAKTVNRHDGGAALLKEPRRLFLVTQAVRRALPASVAVTAKVRLGFDHKDFHREIAAAIEEAGADHIVVHARTRNEMYTPPAHWEYIQSMREGRSRLKFVANGEIWNCEDYALCRQRSGVEDVALGRGLVRNPNLALEIRASLDAGQPQPRPLDRFRFLESFFTTSKDWRGGAYAVARLKQLLRYWSLHDSRLAEWFKEVRLFDNAGQVRSWLDRARPCHSSTTSSL